MEERKYLTEEEFARFLGAVRAEKDARECARNVAIFTVMYWRGLRASEIGKLQLTSWRQKAGSLYVVRAKGSLSGEYLLSPPEARALKAWARERGAQPGPLFPSRNGTGIGRAMLHVLMRKYGERAGLPRDLRHCHVLKHSIGTHLIGKLDVKAVQDWLGHKDIKSTMVYTQFRSKDRDAASRRIYDEAA